MQYVHTMGGQTWIRMNKNKTNWGVEITYEVKYAKYCKTCYSKNVIKILRVYLLNQTLISFSEFIFLTP